MYVNKKKVIICRDLVILTSHDPETPTLDKKIFQYFCSSHRGISACQKSKWDLYGFLKYFLIRKKLTKNLRKCLIWKYQQSCENIYCININEFASLGTSVK